MQEIGLMERFADPALFETLTSGEKAAAGLVTTLMGVGTTFLVLIMLWGIIALTSKIIRGAEKKAVVGAALKSAVIDVKSKEATSIGVIGGGAPAPNGQAASVSVEAGQELIAVLMAAIAASSGDAAASNLKIRKIQRISGYSTAWNAAGVNDCIDSRKF
jgi:Na+-transporting methylmalonyl-CoA/oxaloacetate decarboxylase gamma subunit